MEPDVLFGRIYQKVEGEDQRAAVCHAYELAREAHAPYRRSSGELFLEHTLKTAGIVQDWGLGAELIVMALLHDVLDAEHCVPGITAENIQTDFGQATAEVAGEMARLGYVRTAYEQSGAIDELSKVLEGTRNLRVGLLKLASGLELSGDLCHVEELERRRKRAQFLLAAYGPVAQRYGMWEVKSKLEDYCLEALLPDKTSKVRAWRDELMANNQASLDDLTAKINARCLELGVTVDLVIEKRHLRSLLEKIGEFRPVFDLTEPEFRERRWLAQAVRLVVLTSRLTDCYLALQAVHEVLTPVANSFSDYIVAPKSNGYASIHTTGRFGQGGQAVSLRVRLRTRRMHELTLRGIIDRTAFELWRLRTEGAPPGTLESLPPLNEADGERRCVAELVDSLIVQADSHDGIRVFTPKGKEIRLATGATTLDLAYAIHTELGHTCTGARVNGMAVPITYRLQNNEVVEIQTSPRSQPEPQWLNIAVTSRAQHKVRDWLNRTPKLRGQKLLNQELAQHGLELGDLRIQPALEALVRSDFGGFEPFLEAVGTGRVAAGLVARRLLEDPQLRLDSRRVVLGPGTDERLGQRRYHIRFAGCCEPAYPEPIVGSLRTHEVVVHRQGCGNLPGTSRQVPVMWQEELAQPIRVEVAIEGFDRIGFIRDIATVLAAHAINVSEFRAQQQGAERGTVDVTLELRDLQVLDPVLLELRSLPDVTSTALRGDSSSAIRLLLQGSAEGRPASGLAYGMPSPYSPGRPITNSRMFFGRQHELSRVISLISGYSHGTGVMICGNRRVGKTSLGLQVAQHHIVQREYVCVFCDMQYLRANDDYQVLRRLSHAIHQQVSSLGLAFNPLLSREPEQDLYMVFEEHLRQLGHRLAGQTVAGKQLLLVLDEFEALLASRESGHLSERFFWALRGWTQMQPQPITVILLGTTLLPRQLESVLSGVLNAFVPVELGPLEPDDARALVVRPVERYLFYEREVPDELLALTACYPYYLHVACSILFSDVVSKRRTTITRGDLEVLRGRMVAAAVSGSYYAWLWNREDRLQSLLLSVIARFGDSASGGWLAWSRLPELMAEGDHPDGLLNRLALATEALHDLGTLEKRELQGNLSFRIRLPLFRQWMAYHQPFQFMMTRMKSE